MQERESDGGGAEDEEDVEGGDMVVTCGVDRV